MGVYIKGMKMPNNYDVCIFSDWSNLHQTASCKICEYDLCFDDFSKEYLAKRANFCPLVEVQEPHEKLVEFIDVATFEDEDSGTEEVNLGEVFAAYLKMRESKPIIEAEGKCGK